jgi:hypothetical protein
VLCTAGERKRQSSYATTKVERFARSKVSLRASAYLRKEAFNVCFSGLEELSEDLAIEIAA